jgi:hypothetical protein
VNVHDDLAGRLGNCVNASRIALLRATEWSPKPAPFPICTSRTTPAYTWTFTTYITVVNMKAACTSETSAALSTSALCKDMRVELTTTVYT